MWTKITLEAFHLLYIFQGIKGIPPYCIQHPLPTSLHNPHPPSHTRRPHNSFVSPRQSDLLSLAFHILHCRHNFLGPLRPHEVRPLLSPPLPPPSLSLSGTSKADKTNMLMYLLGKDTYWFQPAIVSIAYRTSELSYSAEAMCEGRVAGLGGRSGTTNGWPVPASPFSCRFFMVDTGAAPRRDNPIGVARTLPPTWCTPCCCHIILPLLQLNLN